MLESDDGHNAAEYLLSLFHAKELNFVVKSYLQLLKSVKLEVYILLRMLGHCSRGQVLVIKEDKSKRWRTYLEISTSLVTPVNMANTNSSQQAWLHSS